jgi:hypothetical protein
MGTVRKADESNDLTDAEIEELLDTEESAVEKAILDKLPSDPEEILRRARQRKTAVARRPPPP